MAKAPAKKEVKKEEKKKQFLTNLLFILFDLFMFKKLLKLYLF